MRCVIVATGAAAFVICPGGGHGGLADHEGTDYATWINSPGIDAGELMPSERIAGLPPVCNFHTHEDTSVNLEPIPMFAMRMKEAGRPYALHVYEKGPHGVGLGPRPYDPARLHPWTSECRRWLTAHGYTSHPTDPQAPH